MPKLKPISGKELIKLFSRLGYVLDHQSSSHMILRQTSPPHRRLTIPNHNPISIGTLRAIIREAGLSREEYEKMAQK
jgi:predicted RNA binding protein YcfA (HicA-like mRNA interferase family)